MQFSVQLGPYLPATGYSGKTLFYDYLDQAILCDRLGFNSVTLTEHHLLSVLIMPAPLQFAIKIADATKSIKIMTAVVVLPLHDMRIFAGEVITADIFTDGRLMLGCGRGAFAFETARLGVPLENTKKIFDESLDVLQALLSEEEVSWDGDHYRFDALTVVPRPVRAIPIMMACATPKSIYSCSRRGFHIQTTPLSGDYEQLMELVNTFHRGKEDAGEKGRDLTLSVSRIGFMTKSDTDKKAKLDMANYYYSQFDNVFTGPGIVEHGLIKSLPRQQTLEQLEKNLMLGPPTQIVDKLSMYARAGVNQFIFNPNFGVGQTETLETIQCFAEEVIPYLGDA